MTREKTNTFAALALADLLYLFWHRGEGLIPILSPAQHSTCVVFFFFDK